MEWTDGSIDLAAPVSDAGGSCQRQRIRGFRDEGACGGVVAYDFGIKQNILRLLVDHGCEVTVVPARTSAADVLTLKPDGVFLSNGPGDPEPVEYAVENIRKLLGARADIWDLLGASVVRARVGREDIQIKIWASWLESSGEEFADFEGGDYRAESWILRRPGFVAGKRCGDYTREFERSYE